MSEELYLTDLIPVDKLQALQEGYSRMTGMAAGISDANGLAVTEPSLVCDFCAKMTKGTELGAKRCRQCDRMGGELALKAGKAVVYVCHAGLVDCAAPILVEGRLIGSFNSGQVRAGDLDEDKVRKTAAELGIDPEEYLTAAKATREVDAGVLLQTMEFVYTVTNSLSDMAYKQYQLRKANEEVERTARMKSDFLANMSHEIRTPMNGVIGMAELALREELPPAAREYVNQIRDSGRTLLAIMNDILDFSKIESGKLDIYEEEYEPLSLVNDVAAVVTAYIGDKPVELNLDIPPDIPGKLRGDSIRIKQSLLNLTNNAVKFTQKGQVKIQIAYSWLDSENVDLQVNVSDTGMGIKPEDQDRIFLSFQQADSKRNRQIEGTGLGLAISRQLIHLMHGEITVKSEYGKGSTFSFHIPQKVVRKQSSITMGETAPPITAAMIKNYYTAGQLKTDVVRLGGSCRFIDSTDRLDEEQMVSLEYLFVEWELFTASVQDFAKANPNVTVVVILDFKKQAEYSQKNVIIMKKPFYVLNLVNIFKHEKDTYSDKEEEDFWFIAPDAHILAVDDNAVNLTVTKGLLEPLKMRIDTASSGREAIDKISVYKYDLIFMDHMMPELDGVETTHIIRRFHPEYNDVPIIALTANAIDGTREMFISEGMNDFVPKPIEIRSLVSKLHYWLPLEKQIRTDIQFTEKGPEESSLEIQGLDTEYALSILGSEKLYRSVLKDYYRVIDKKIRVIQSALEEKDWGTYTLELHALKSASRQIGAIELSEMAAELEKAGNARDTEKICEKTPAVLKLYRTYQEILGPFYENQEEDRVREPVSDEQLSALLDEMRDALENLDMDRIEEVIRTMDGYAFEGEQKELFEKLKSDVEEYDLESCGEVLDRWQGNTFCSDIVE